MKVIYDNETDTLSIILRAGKVAESDEVRKGLIFDYDKSGRLLSLELLDASGPSKAASCSRVRARSLKEIFLFRDCCTSIGCSCVTNAFMPSFTVDTPAPYLSMLN
jgi:uncharacterized protein YuzE